MLCLEDQQFDMLMPKQKHKKEDFTAQIDDPVILEMERAFQSGDQSSLEALMSSFEKKDK